MSRHRPGRKGRELMAWVSEVLAARRHGWPVEAPDWLSPEALHAIELPLDGRSPMTVALRDGVSSRTVPSRLGPPGPAGGGDRALAWPLRVVRAPVMRAQSHAPELTIERSAKLGTAAALVRDRLAPDRQYLLTCGHVVAPDIAARVGDAVSVALDGQTWTGHLCEWQPALGEGVPAAEIDAGLVELDAATLQRLLETIRAGGDLWLPTGIDERIAPDRPVALQRCASQGSDPLSGHLTSIWSGDVALGDDESFPKYFLKQAVGYRTDRAPQPGDSGAAVLGAGEGLLGMHVGGLDEGASRYGANGVLIRIRPVLDWFSVKPWTRHDPATVGPADWPALDTDRLSTLNEPPPNLGDDTARDLLVLTQTLWAEARGESDEGQEAVAAVIMNRFAVKYRGARTVADVCLTPAQFSCWNAGDPNRAAIARVTAAPDEAFIRARGIARRALGMAGPPLLAMPANVRHYYAASMRPPPSWSLDRPPYRRIGGHLFYAGIA